MNLWGSKLWVISNYVTRIPFPHLNMLELSITLWLSSEEEDWIAHLSSWKLAWTIFLNIIYDLVSLAVGICSPSCICVFTNFSLCRVTSTGNDSGVWFLLWSTAIASSSVINVSAGMHWTGAVGTQFWWHISIIYACFIIKTSASMWGDGFNKPNLMITYY